MICIGCIDAVKAEDDLVLFVECLAHFGWEWVERLKERAGGGDAEAIHNLGCYYNTGRYGLRQNRRKVMKLWLRAGELGHAVAYFNLGTAYDFGEGVERDEKNAKHYYEIAAMGGDVEARHNLSILEEELGNMNRAEKHYMIAAMAGYDKSLKSIRVCFLEGHVTKDDFEKALRAHKEAKDEVKSDQREAAAAARGQN